MFLKSIYDETVAKGRAEGRAKGMVHILRMQMEIKFGALPCWANERLDRAAPAQLKRWARKMLTASSVEAVLGVNAKASGRDCA